MSEISSVEQLRDFLGVDEQRDGEVEMLRESAIGIINKATGRDWRLRDDVDMFNEALRTQVWLSYYAVRDDGNKNTAFLQSYLSGLINSLQYPGNAKEAADGDI